MTHGGRRAPAPTSTDLRRPSRATHDSPPPEVRALRVSRPGAEPIVVRLDVERPQLLVGRGDAVDLRIDSDRVSRVHALVRQQDDHWWYEDMGSTNGSFVVRSEDLAQLHDAESTQEIGAEVLTPKERVRLRVGTAILLGSRHALIEPLSDVPLRIDTNADATLRSDAARTFARDVARAATTHLPVFLLGPSGAGKTTAAQGIHEKSGVRGRFVPINCARLPRDDAHLHSTLLGHVKGSFTGAVGVREGLFVHALGGTLFLDEVESLPEVAQGFLLDVLEGSGMLLPFGATPADPRLALSFRLVSASKKPLGETSLRRDLAERLTEGHVIVVPSLRDRRADIPGLARVILDELSAEQGVRFALSKDGERFLVDARWDGEIRALRAVVRTAATNVRIAADAGAREGRMVVTEEALLEVYHRRRSAFGEPSVAREAIAPTELPEDTSARLSRPVNPRHLTEDDVRRALEGARGNVTHAAQALGVARNTLVAKMRAFGLRAN